MTDILEKLDERINRADHGVDRQMAREAKAEIEKLRAENERLRAAMGGSDETVAYHYGVTYETKAAREGSHD